MPPIKISAMTGATELITSAVIPGVQSGANRKFTIRQLQSEHSTDGVGYTVSMNEAIFSGTVDKAFSIGYNLVPFTAATRIDLTEPQIKWDLEADWNDLGTHYMEANVNYQGADGITVRRPFGIFINRATHNVRLDFQSGAGQQLFFSDNGYMTIGNSVSAVGVFDIGAIRSVNSYAYGFYNWADLTSITQHVYGFYNAPVMTPADTKDAVAMTCGGIIVGTPGQTKNAYSLYISAISKTGAFTVTNAYGIYMEAPTIGTNNYALYVSGGLSRVGDNVGIAVAPTTANKLYIGGSISVAAYAYGINLNSNLTSSTSHIYGASIYPGLANLITGKNYYGLHLGLTQFTSAGSGEVTLLYISNTSAKTGTLSNQYGIYIEALTQGSTNYSIYTGAGRVYFGGTVGILVAAPSAYLHLPACTAAANTASLKINPGIVAVTPVSGNIESDGTHLYWTDNGGTRRQLDN